MHLALLTCQRLPDLTLADQVLIPELARHNIKAKAVIWDDPTINWKDFDYLIFRNTWDYYEKEIAFNSWLDHIDTLGIKTLNTLETIKKNKHKFYLRELENEEISIIPTLFIEKTTTLNLAALLPKHWKKAVIKPAFSAGSYLTTVFEVADIEKINAQYQSIASQKELLLQEFIPQIQTLGETSLIFFNKKFSHAVNKMPAKNDFRVQLQFGGTYTCLEPNPELISKAQQIVNTFPDPLLYARVDGIVVENQLLLMEIECIEPDLYFNICEGATQRFVASIVEIISKKTS